MNSKAKVIHCWCYLSDICCCATFITHIPVQVQGSSELDFTSWPLSGPKLPLNCQSSLPIMQLWPEYLQQLPWRRWYRCYQGYPTRRGEGKKVLQTSVWRCQDDKKPWCKIMTLHTVHQEKITRKQDRAFNTTCFTLWECCGLLVSVYTYNGTDGANSSIDTRLSSASLRSGWAIGSSTSNLSL